MTKPNPDERTTGQLIQAALKLADDDEAWEAVVALHWRGTREVLDEALVLSASSAPEERELAADILGQLGVPERSFPQESYQACVRLLADEDAGVLQSALVALGHIDRSRALPYVLPLASHPEAEVREAVAVALGGVEDDQAIGVLLLLSTDEDSQVRDWATFGIARMSEADSPAIREALIARLNDPDPDVRYEAICGLGERCGPRASDLLKELLKENPDDVFVREAAAKFQGLES